MHPLPYSAPPTLKQATTHPGLCQRLLDTHRQVQLDEWLVGSLFLSPGSWGAQGFVYVPSNNLFPQSCVSFVIKSQLPPKSNEAKDKGEKERYTHLRKQSSKKQQGEIRKPSLVIKAKKYRKTIQQERLEISSRKSEIPREYCMQRLAQ